MSFEFLSQHCCSVILWRCDLSCQARSVTRRIITNFNYAFHLCKLFGGTVCKGFGVAWKYLVMLSFEVLRHWRVLVRKSGHAEG
jgi:hypothetical protein